jgi:hypothetical protein
MTLYIVEELHILNVYIHRVIFVLIKENIIKFKIMYIQFCFDCSDVIFCFNESRARIHTHKVRRR